MTGCFFPLLSWVPVEGDPQNLSNMRGFYSTFGEEGNRVREGGGQPKATQLRRTEIKIDPSAPTSKPSVYTSRREYIGTTTPGQTHKDPQIMRFFSPLSLSFRSYDGYNRWVGPRLQEEIAAMYS